MVYNIEMQRLQTCSLSLTNSKNRWKKNGFMYSDHLPASPCIFANESGEMSAKDLIHWKARTARAN